MKPKFEIGQKVYADLGDDEEIIPIYENIIKISTSDEGFPIYSFATSAWWVDEFKLYDNKLQFLAYLSGKIEKLIGASNETKI